MSLDFSITHGRDCRRSQQCWLARARFLCRLDAAGICRNQLIEEMGRQRIDRRIVEHQRGAQRPLDTEVLAEQIAKLHRHQRIKTQIHEAIVAIRRRGRIEPENLNHALAHEVAHEIETIRRERIEDALPE